MVTLQNGPDGRSGRREARARLGVDRGRDDDSRVRLDDSATGPRDGGSGLDDRGIGLVDGGSRHHEPTRVLGMTDRAVVVTDHPVMAIRSGC